MTSKKGFTLIEILTVLLIIGILVACAVPSFLGSMEQTRAQSAQSNLLAISAGEQKFYEDYTVYCVGVAPPSGLTLICGDSIADLTANLNLSMGNDPYFTYSCVAAGQGYSCTAADANVQLTTSGTGSVSCTSLTNLGTGVCATLNNE